VRSNRFARTLLHLSGAALAVAVATVGVAVVEDGGGVPNASSIYLVAVVLIAVVGGTVGAVLTAFASIAVYDFLFTNPRRTLAIADPTELLSLVVLLFVAVAVGELAALQRRRAEVAVAREREARALFQVTRALATRRSTPEALPGIAAILASEARLNRVWFSLGADDRGERVVATDGSIGAPPRPAAYAVLHRPSAGDAKWTLVREPGPGRATDPASRADGPRVRAYRVRIEAGGTHLGSIWATRSIEDRAPDASATRLLGVAADQVGQALAQDHLLEEARTAEIARQSDALKTALLESVSHDLRTPLSSIRASAGTLMDADVVLDRSEIAASATSIDREAERLNALVANLLDLGRIEGAALHAAQEVLDVEDSVGRAVGLVRARAGERSIEVDARGGLTVLADPVLLEQALLNLLDNAIRHTPEATPIRVSASATADRDMVRITVEDGGPGVADVSIPRLFEKFYRVPAAGRSRAPGTGIGLAVVRGVVAAMEGRVTARKSVLGGLAVDVDLPLVTVPVEIVGGRGR
jgi:two-component system sensor histidine kinase KdpD